MLRIALIPMVAAFAATSVPAFAEDTPWQANPQLVQQLTEKRPQFNWDEAHVPKYELPDPLKLADGNVVRTPEEWKRRRAETLELFRTHVYGRRPGKPEQLDFKVVEEQKAAMDGAATLKRVAVRSRQQGREHEFVFTLLLPNKPATPAGQPATPAGQPATPAPVFLLLNNRGPENVDPTRAQKSGFWPAEEVIARGYGIAALQNGDLAPDDKDRFREGVIRLFEGDKADRPADAWGALAAWGWGASRVMDYFETDPRVDADRVAVIGHSRGGKAALWTGAEDERFALVISNNSGCGGAAVSRRRLGETVARINTSFPHWFCDNFKTFNDREDDLPIDQHQLIALIAPRLVAVGSADQDLWADPRGEFLAVAHASPVYALWQQPAMDPAAMPPLDRPLVTGTRSYHIRTGSHNLRPQDWGYYMDFADRHWKTDETANERLGP